MVINHWLTTMRLQLIIRRTFYRLLLNWEINLRFPRGASSKRLKNFQEFKVASWDSSALNSIESTKKTIAKLEEDANWRQLEASAGPVLPVSLVFIKSSNNFPWPVIKMDWGMDSRSKHLVPNVHNSSAPVIEWCRWFILKRSRLASVTALTFGFESKCVQFGYLNIDTIDAGSGCLNYLG